MGRTACTEPQCLYKGTLYQEQTQNLQVPRIIQVSDIKNITDWQLLRFTRKNKRVKILCM